MVTDKIERLKWCIYWHCKHYNCQLAENNNHCEVHGLKMYKGDSMRKHLQHKVQRCKKNTVSSGEKHTLSGSALVNHLFVHLWRNSVLLSKLFAFLYILIYNRVFKSTFFHFGTTKLCQLSLVKYCPHTAWQGLDCVRAEQQKPFWRARLCNNNVISTIA